MQPPPPSFARRFRPWIALGGGALILLVLFFGMSGVALRSNSGGAKSSAPSQLRDDPWPKFAAALRKDVDVESLRRTLTELNSDLGRSPTAQQPAETADAELADVTRLLTLIDGEAREIKPSVYSQLDAAYLAECLYLRDIAVSLGGNEPPAAKRAATAFGWVVRQIALTTPTAAAPGLPPLSPSYVLRRGSGTALERAYVFLELCRQLGVDAYLIGDPKPDTPKATFWAVGVRADKRVQLFDLRAGEPLPFDLEQLRAGAPEFAERAAALAKANEMEPAALRESRIFLAVPLSAFAARWKLVEERLDAERGLKLYVDRERLTKAAEGVAKGAPVAFWNPSGDRHTLARTLAHTLSEAEGGFAPTEGNGLSQLGNLYVRSLLPGDLVFSLPPNFVAFKEPRDRVMGDALKRYFDSFLKAPTPRERFQRGQFPEATRALVREWDAYTKMGERAAAEADRQAIIKSWQEKVTRVYTDFNADPADLRARAAVEQFWKTEVRGTELLVEAIAAAPGTAEAIYLLALCKQEQAERATGPAAADAWAVAADWWKRYEKYAADQDRAFPGRQAHAKALAERAGKMSR